MGEVAGITAEPLQRILAAAEGSLASLREEGTRRGYGPVFHEVVTG